ncbi:MAG TPA: OsmC family protein [Gammaproteobacteria bacterium]|nr:OsmC family protein [Gammaproteobacteria bacterium]
MESQNLRFQNTSGLMLSGILDLPITREAKAYALVAHCFTCGKNLVAMRNISRTLTREGIAVFRFDFMGLGNSEGDFSETNFSSNVADLIDAATYLEKHYQAPKLLIGHSLGGPAAIMASTQLSSCQAVVTIGSPYDPEHVTHLFQALKTIIRRKGEATANIGGRHLTIKKQFLDDLENISMRSVISSLKKALLVCHSPVDTTVGIEQAANIYGAAKHPKSFISLDDADHLLTKEKDSLYIGEVIASWAKRYINLPIDTGPVVRGKKQYVIVRSEGEDYTTEINANGHALIADEPIALGGKNLGPSPYELLASSLGACTAMTLQMYAKYKKLHLDSVTVYLQHNKVHAEDGAGCENKAKKIDVIERKIEVKGNLSEKQRERLLEIADRCPVHQTLRKSVKIKSWLGEN